MIIYKYLNNNSAPSFDINHKGSYNCLKVYSFV